MTVYIFLYFCHNTYHRYICPVLHNNRLPDSYPKTSFVVGRIGGTYVRADFSRIYRTMFRFYYCRRTTGLMIGLSIIPRYAGITHTADHILLYEDITFWGTELGNLFFLFHWNIRFGTPFLILYGLFSGIFLGGWIMALAEMADIFPIFARRSRFQRGLSFTILCIAAGKTVGALIYYYNGWLP